MVVSNPVPPELQGRPFVEQARSLPARVALEAFFAAATGFTEEPSAGSAFLRVLERVASAIFRGDTLLQVRGFSPGQQMDSVGRAVHQLVRENYLQLVDFPEFEAAMAALSQAVQGRAADVNFELSICVEARAPDLVEGLFQVNDRVLNAPVTVAQVHSMLDARDAANKRDFETMLGKSNEALTTSITTSMTASLTGMQQQITAALAAFNARMPPAAAPAPAPPATTLALAGAGGVRLPQQGAQPGAGAPAPAAAPGQPQQPPPLVEGSAPPQLPPPPLERPEGGAPLSAEAPTFVPGGLQHNQQAAAPGPAPASPTRHQPQVFDPPASPGLELAQKVYADINNKWCEVSVLGHQGGMICVQ